MSKNASGSLGTVVKDEIDALVDTLSDPASKESRQNNRHDMPLTSALHPLQYNRGDDHHREDRGSRIRSRIEDEAHKDVLSSLYVENIVLPVTRDRWTNGSQIRLIEETRKSEAKLLSRLKNGDDWAIQDLKPILQSLNARLDAMKTQFQPGSQLSMAQRLILYLLNGANPSEEDLLRTIEAVNSELCEVESKLARVSTTDDASISTATISLGASPENVSRKRTRVSISPA